MPQHCQDLIKQGCLSMHSASQLLLCTEHHLPQTGEDGCTCRWAHGMITPGQPVHLIIYLVLPETSVPKRRAALQEACQVLAPCLPVWQQLEAPALKVPGQACHS